jgi:hypothetical protein
MEWIDLAQDMIMNGNESSGSIKYWEIFEWLHSRRFLKKGSAP